MWKMIRLSVIISTHCEIKKDCSSSARWFDEKYEVLHIILYYKTVDLWNIPQRCLFDRISFGNIYYVTSFCILLNDITKQINMMYAFPNSKSVQVCIKNLQQR